MVADENRLSICHIVAPGPVGGLERVVQGLATGHHRMGHDVSVISVIGPKPGPHPFAQPLTDAGVSLFEIRLPGRAVIRERWAVRSALERMRPDVVHFHGYRPELLHRGIVRALGIPFATTEHGSSKLGGSTAFFEWLQLRLFRFADAVIAVSSPIARRLEQEGVPRRRIHMVPNGWTGGVELLEPLEARRRLGIPPGARAVGFVGRLIRAKGPDVFVEAIERVDRADLHAVIVGDGEMMAALKDRASRVKNAQITFTGHLDNAAPLFSAFDIFALTSRTEGTPIVLFEAISSGTPVIATEVGGVPDVVGQAEAWLSPPEDASALASALAAALDEPGEARDRARRARDRLETRFGADQWLNRHADIYRRISGRAVHS